MTTPQIQDEFFAAAGSWDAITVKELLTNAGADINGQCDDGQTALMLACHSWHPPTIRMLLEHGADVHIQDHEGNTALHHCFGEETSVEQIELVLNHGADANALNNRMQNPLMVGVLKMIDNESHFSGYVLDLLIEKGADLWHADINRVTPGELIVAHPYKRFSQALKLMAQSKLSKEGILDSLDEPCGTPRNPKAF